ncbi:MAG: hypothetical protein OQL19_10245 [Gammaproteobacteria bacterium]|nr:hypothetical protein [Gammaproteobacteria bacterium]
MTTVDENGKEVGIFVDWKKINNTPSWNIENEEPPISVGNAVLIVNKWQKENHSSLENYTIDSFTLHKYHCNKVDDKWVYILNFTPSDYMSRMSATRYMVAVLMDGTVVTPREVPIRKKLIINNQR